MERKGKRAKELNTTMCGICGFTGALPEDMPVLKSMCDVMAHRGPDGEGQYLADGIALGHRRLSLIDLQGGNQPLVRATGERASEVTSPALAADGTFVQGEARGLARGQFAIVFNGEIYNYRDLRAELEADGWQFATNSDTEVLLVSYLAWGQEALNRLRGMFAFAIWDASTRELFCARDFFGIKPFYYTLQHTARGAQFIFASEAIAAVILPSSASDDSRQHISCIVVISASMRASLSCTSW